MHGYAQHQRAMMMQEKENNRPIVAHQVIDEESKTEGLD